MEYEGKREEVLLLLWELWLCLWNATYTHIDVQNIFIIYHQIKISIKRQNKHIIIWVIVKTGLWISQLFFLSILFWTYQIFYNKHLILPLFKYTFKFKNTWQNPWEALEESSNTKRIHKNSYQRCKEVSNKYKEQRILDDNINIQVTYLSKVIQMAQLSHIWNPLQFGHILENLP